MTGIGDWGRLAHVPGCQVSATNQRSPAPSSTFSSRNRDIRSPITTAHDATSYLSEQAKGPLSFLCFSQPMPAPSFRPRSVQRECCSLRSSKTLSENTAKTGETSSELCLPLAKNPNVGGRVVPCSWGIVRVYSVPFALTPFRISYETGTAKAAFSNRQPEPAKPETGNTEVGETQRHPFVTESRWQ